MPARTQGRRLSTTAPGSHTSTTRILDDGAGRRLLRQRLALQVLDGPDRGRTVSSGRERNTVGSARQNDLVLRDPAVSRHHLRVETVPRGFLVTDLDSTNGTWLGSLRLHQVTTAEAIELRLGDTRLRLQPLAEEEEVRLAESDCFGAVLGRSAAMRELFAALEAAAPLETTVLLEGETGTGKELLAEEIHRHSARRDGPFLVVDCGAIPPSLLEGELFGHARGAFTGAVEQRRGVFEEADGGTVFLDEIGELDLAMQPRLLRVLERRQIRRLGESRYRDVDVRIVAATNRDLQRGVNQGTFRPDLFYRLGVVHLRIPPLRERADDIELLASRLLPEVAARIGAPAEPLSPQTLQEMRRHAWPGNVRELRNFLERLLSVARGGQVPRAPSALVPHPAAPGTPTMDELCALSFHEAKNAWIASFDLAYLSRLLEQAGHNVAEAARRSQIDRAHLFRLIKKYGITRR
jgi:two-component system, NtrC family, response regulator GlrR